MVGGIPYLNKTCNLSSYTIWKLNLFEKHDIRYLVVGGYAVMKYSEPR